MVNKQMKDSFAITRCAQLLVCNYYCRVSLTAKITNEWVFNKAGVKWELLDTVKAGKPAYYGHTRRTQGSCLKKEIMH